MKTGIVAFGLMFFVLLGTQAGAAECYLGVWVVDGSAVQERLEIKDDGCLLLAVTDKAAGGEVKYDTCYKFLEKKDGKYLLEIDHESIISVGEVTCLDNQLHFRWTDVADRVYDKQ